MSELTKKEKDKIGKGCTIFLILLVASFLTYKILNLWVGYEWAFTIVGGFWLIKSIIGIIKIRRVK